jgi:hyperosmotically inducible protein
MKNLITACSVALVIFGIVQIVAGSPVPLQGERERLETDIRHELAGSITIFDNVTFKVDADRTVTLFGQVREPRVKDHAEQDAKKVKGVGRVQNRIEVLPLSPSDDRLRLALYRAIYSQQGFDRYARQVDPPVHIIVKNGAVSLEGTVATKAEHTQANIAANEVSGVFSVKNNLRIESAD